MQDTRRNPIVLVTAILTVIFGLVLAVGGIALISVGGSWYYLIAALGFVLTGWLLFRRNAAALGVYALLLTATLVWSLWEVWLDWWPLVARLDVPFLLGLLLLTPWITRALQAGRADGAAHPSRVSALRGTGRPLTAALAVVAVVSMMSLFNDRHRIEGVAPAARTAAAADALGVAAGEWPAYGRTAYGQRYSPLDQISPDNVANLEVAWTYRTGDMRGRPGDPAETTFEVTPLKVGNRLFLCTPHQSVIALDATTGKQLWRLDPKIQGDLALQHLTCRGLSYHAGADALARTVAAGGAAPGGAAGDGASELSTMAGQQVAPATAVDDATISANPTPSKATIGNIPIAAAQSPTSDDCRDRLFMPTADGRLLAINPDNGKVCARFGGGHGQINLWTNMPFVNPGSYYSTSPVVVTASLIIVGGTVLDNVSTTEPSGVIRAFDVDTGALVWNWDSGNPDDTAPIAPGQTYTPNSPNSWSTSSVDEALGLVYVPLGNQPPDQWGGNRSASVERYSSSVVALDLSTGRVRWVFQTVHHDLWDYDVPSQPSLIDLTIGGKTVPALVQPTKQGEIYVLDRRTGAPLLPVTEVPVPQGAAAGDRTSPTQPVSALSYDPPPLAGRDMWGATIFDQLACRIAFHKLRYEGRYTPPSTQGSLVSPGNFGVFNWGSIAVDPQRQIAFTTPTYLAFVSKLIPRKDATTLYVQPGGSPPPGSLPAINENFGAPFAVDTFPFLSPLGIPCQAPPWGYVAAADLTTGKILWKHKNGTVRDSSPLPLPFKMGVPNIGGPIMTGGGVAFLSGTMDDYVRAYNVSDGEQLWESRLPAGGQATPMTYLGADGRQYLLVAAGGHGSTGTRTGDYIIAYALPGTGR